MRSSETPVLLALLAGALFAEPPTRTLTLPATPSLECRVACGPRAGTAALAFSPDGRTLAAGGHGEAVLWDVAEGRLVRRLDGLPGAVRSLAWAPSGGILAAGCGLAGRNGSVRLLDSRTGKEEARFEEPRDVVGALAFSPDGALLASGSDDGVVRVWSLVGAKLLAELSDHQARVSAVSFSADGCWLVTGGADGALRIFDTAGWKSASVTRLPDSIRAAAVGPGGWLAAAVGDAAERALRLWPGDGTPVRIVDLGAAGPRDLAWIGATGRVAVAGADGILRIHDPLKRATVAVPTGHFDWIDAVASSADGSRLATGSADGLVKLFTGEGKPLATFAHLAPGKDVWLVLTAPGYVDCSDPGMLDWKTAVAGATSDIITAKLRNADLVKQVLSGKAVPPPVLK